MDQHSKQYFLVQVLLCRCPAAERKDTGVYNLPYEFMLGDVDMPMLLADDITGRANKLLGLLTRNLSTCDRRVKEAAYLGLARPLLEYAIQAWDPYTDNYQTRSKRHRDKLCVL